MKSQLLVLCAAAALAMTANVALADVKQPAVAVAIAEQAPQVQPAVTAVHEAKAQPSKPERQVGDPLDPKMLSLLLGLSLFAGMINFIQPGNAITAAAPYQRNSGQGALLGGSLFGVAVDTVASGATGVFWTEGVYELTKLSGAAESFTLGKRVFWDDTNKRLTVVSTANVAVGVVTEAAATDAVVARIKLVGTTPAGT
jgi:predicted RecA/RadA family phage recombinase